MPEFSVIIPCYNAASYVQAAIDSCLAQTVSDVEIIVVDDGSTDGSGEIVAAAAARHTQVRVVRQVNRGLGAARNAGLRVATGAFVSFLDADDLIEPEKLAEQGAVLRDRPEVGLVLCHGVGVDAENVVHWENILDGRRFAGHPSLFEELFAGGGAFPPLVALIRRELAAAVGGFDEDRAASGWADTAFWMRLALTGMDYHIVERPLARYRVLSTSMSSDRLGMERAAETIYAKVMSDHPLESARALRAAHQRLQDTRAAVDFEIGRQTYLAECLRASQASSRRTLVVMLSRICEGEGARPLWIWGAGAAGRRGLQLLRAADIHVEAFIDSDPEKAGGRIEELPIVSPDALRQDAAVKPFVLVASRHGDVIAERLEACGWQATRDYHLSDLDAPDLADIEAAWRQPAGNHHTT
jgi:glycosyltransferase involved in cell wall biosynthesis